MGKLILVRHGQTQMNVDGIFFGKLDPSLNETGKEQCKKTRELLKDRYKYDFIYSSDLKRASETAEIVNYLDLPIKLDRRLEEIDFGIFEGLSYKEILEKYPAEAKKVKRSGKLLIILLVKALKYYKGDQLNL